MTAPTLTPAFRDFLPGWIARQPWYRGAGVPATRPVGFFRLEDPAGEVGIETHLLTDGAAVYQIPMSYRRAPLRQLADGSTADTSVALIAAAEHSEWYPDVCEHSHARGTGQVCSSGYRRSMAAEVCTGSRVARLPVR